MFNCYIISYLRLTIYDVEGVHFLFIFVSLVLKVVVIIVLWETNVLIVLVY